MKGPSSFCSILSLDIKGCKILILVCSIFSVVNGGGEAIAWHENFEMAFARLGITGLEIY